MSRLIGTAGHVDHGKTTLIRALTGIDADRLPEEKKRGMTIDIGFAYIDLPRAGRVSIVDVPGHEKFLTNMLVGALGIDVALLCVSADESVMPQTREHLQILEVLPVEKLVVALTRADLADDDVRALATAEVEELVAASRFKSAEIVPVSAFTGEGIDLLREKLDVSLEDESTPDQKRPWYMPIDRVFTVKGHGVVVTGTLAQGRVAVGDEALVMPEGFKVRIRSIHSHDESVESSEKGRRTALNLSGVKAEQMYRGQQIGRPDAVFASMMIDARVNWVQEPKHAMRVRVSIGAEEAIGKLFLNDHDAELAQIRLDKPVACSLEQPLIIRRYSPPDLLGGGRVVVPQAKKRRRNEQLVTVSAAVDDGAAILHVLQDRIEGLPTEEICRRLGRTPQALGTTFERMMAAKQLFGFAGLWFDPASLELAFDRFNTALLTIHHAKPSQSHWPRETVVQKAGLHWTGKPLDRLLQHWAGEGRIYLNGTQVRSAEFVVKLNEKQESLLSRVEAVIRPAGMNVPSVEDISKKVFVPIQATEEILRLGIETGRICRVADGLYYPVGTLDEIKSSLAAKYGKGPFSAADVRDMFQSSRRYVIPLLEFFDSQGWTIRQGDVRRIA